MANRSTCVARLVLSAIVAKDDTKMIASMHIRPVVMSVLKRISFMGAENFTGFKINMSRTLTMRYRKGAFLVRLTALLVKLESRTQYCSMLKTLAKVVTASMIHDTNHELISSW